MIKIAAITINAYNIPTTTLTSPALELLVVPT